MEAELPLAACRCCGQIHRLPPALRQERRVCCRCGTAFRTGTNRNTLAGILALLALACYWPAMLWPVVTLRRLGQHQVTSLLDGTLDLFSRGEWFIGGVILLFSILLPLFKLLLLLELCLFTLLPVQHRALTYRTMEFIGRWGMLDVMIIALVVMLVKMGNLITFTVGPAIYAFVACVTLSLLATFFFDARALWVEAPRDI